MAGAYCADKLTDEFVPDWFVRQLADGSRTVRILIAEGLTTRHAGEGGGTPSFDTDDHAEGCPLGPTPPLSTNPAAPIHNVPEWQRPF